MFFLLEEQPSSVSFLGWDKYPLCLQEMNVYFLYFGKVYWILKKKKKKSKRDDFLLASMC